MPYRFGPWESALIIFIIFPYIWNALCLHIIANKTGTPNGWFAWIPILNIYLLCKVAGHSGWWTLAIILVPLLDIIVTIWFWVDIARVRKRPAWLGVLMIIPVVNLIIPGVLAFSDST